MKRILAGLTAVMAAGCGGAEPPASANAAPAVADTTSSVSVAYAPMASFVRLAGTAWRGEGVGPNGQPITDIARYEMILGGRAFQSTHLLEGGDYGGRTIIFFDESAQSYIFHYFTTAGFHTIGEITPSDTGFTAVEQVIGHAEFSEVRSEAFYGEDVIRIVSSHVKKDGEVSPGDELVYRRIDDPGPLYPVD